jgi:osmotically-inducible protein OsmY
MRSAIFTVLGVCGVLSFGCASMQKVEKEAAGAAKEAEKSGALKDVEKAVEKKVDGSKDTKTPAPGAAGGADVDKGVQAAMAPHATMKASNAGGVVTISGKAATAKDKADAEAAVKGVKGVTKVVNEVAVGK